VSAQLDIPDYVSEENRRKILELGEESPREISQVECCEYLIRHWCETIEDGNPLYLDETYARSRGFRGLVAQPGMLICTLTLPYRWPWPEGYRSQRLIHFHLKKLLELPVGILANYEKWFYEPVQVGDRLSSTVRLRNISPFKRTRLGEGYFTTIETNYYNQHDVVVARSDTTLFSYGGKRGADGEPLPEGAESPPPLAANRVVPNTTEDQAPADPPGEDAIAGGWHNATEECLESWRTGWKARPPAELCWEDVAVGDELQELVMPITVTRCSLMASASRDFAPQHHNSWYAQNKSKTRDMFLGTHFNLGMMSRFLTDWAGPLASVRRIQLAMRRSVCAGEDMVMTGRVAEKYEKDGERRVDVDVEIATERGSAYEAGGTLALPSRAGTPS
jgi:acyl dehydratase